MIVAEEIYQQKKYEDVPMVLIKALVIIWWFLIWAEEPLMSAS